MVRWMEYEKFYRLCIDYNFMLKDAVHFGAYSETGLKNIWNELEELLEPMADDPVYAQYKTLLQELHQAVSSGSNISRFLPRIQRLHGKIRARKLACDIPLYLLCVFAFVTAGMLPMMLRK